MDLIHCLLNITAIPSVFVALLFLVPLYFIVKLVCLIRRSKNPENVAGKVVLITGASSGIGEELAYEYARRGARLALVARREDRLREVANKARSLGSPDAIFICADVSKIEDCERFIEEAVIHFGQLDHLVNNAGVAQIKLFQEFSHYLSDLAPIMDINFWGSVYPTHFAVQHLRKSKGKIVVISSTAAYVPTPRMSFYNASKAAIVSLYETLRAEFGPDIGITIVTPGMIKSEITQDQLLLQALQANSMPIQSAESCAKEIVKSTCRGDLYLTEPCWIRVAVWLKWFLPAPMLWLFYHKYVKWPALAAKRNG